MGHANSAEEHKLVSSFETIRRTLMQDRYKDRLDKPLAYWALPKDRRLPLAFLGRSVGELLSTPFDELTATRGIGHKKISSLVKLLHRATAEAPPAVPYGLSDLAEELEQNQSSIEPTNSQSFDSSLVSEALWVQWCETARRFGLGNENLGRLAPTLQSLPTVIWSTPLREYMYRSIDEIRNLRTHGEKRVRVVLEIFHAMHELLSNASLETHLSVRLVPRFVQDVEHWISVQLQSKEVPTRQDVEKYLGQPLLDQIRRDAGEAVYELVQDRLGIAVPRKSVREQSREMGVTRARVYQLLEECGSVIDVRWPEGIAVFSDFSAALAASDMSGEGVNLIKQIRQLFFSPKSDRKSTSEADADRNSDGDSEGDSIDITAPEAIGNAADQGDTF